MYCTNEIKFKLISVMRKREPFQGGTSLVNHSCYFCCMFVMLLWASDYCCLVVTCWERADLLALVYGVLL